MSPDLEKLPPHDVAAEEAVIGSLLVDEEAIYRVSTFLRPDDFYREVNRWAYEACLALYDRNEAINQITLAHELTYRDRLEAVGGIAYLSHLRSIVPTSVHVEYYGQIVYRTSMMRKLIDAAGKIAAIGYESGPDVDTSLARAEDMIFRLRHGQSPRDFVHIRDILDRYFDESGFTPRSEDGQIPHIKTGFIDLDNLLGGLQRSDLIILAARPSLGKTSLALNIARNTALDQGANVALFSLEMSKEQLVQRLLSGESGVDSQRIRGGLDKLSHADQDRVNDSMGVLAKTNIYIDDSPMLRVVEMRSKARRLMNERGIDLIVVDYLQLVRGSFNTDNRVQEISDISRSLKGLARELNVPVLSVSQLSRAVEMRSPKIPQLSDLRESGSIEQDADVVAFIYRDDVYYTEEDWRRQFPDKEYPKGVAQILVAKHRNGPVGSIHLRFVDNLAQFRNFSARRGPDGH